VTGVQTCALPISAALSGDGTTPDGHRYVLRKVLIGYASVLFHALLLVDETGNVEIVEDQPLGRIRLPIAEYRFQERFGRNEPLSPSVLVELQAPVDPADRSVWAQVGPALVAPTEAALRRGPSAPDDVDERREDSEIEVTGYQIERLPLKGETVYRPLRFRGVTFFEDVDLREAAFEHSLTFEDCVFMGRLIAESLTVHGRLIFERCDFKGLAAPSESALQAEEIALHLEGANIGNDLVISRCRVDGILSARGADVRGRGKILSTRVRPPAWLGSGPAVEGGEPLLRLAIRPHEWKPAGPAGPEVPRDNVFLAEARPAGIDLRDSRFKVGLDIGQYKPRDGETSLPSELLRIIPTTINGPLRGSNCRVEGPVCLFGLLTARFRREVLDPRSPNVLGGHWVSVDFDGARIGGSLQTWKTSDRTEQPWPWHAAENVVCGELSICGAHIDGEIDLRGIWVEQDLRLSRTDVGDGVQLNPMGKNAANFDESPIEHLPGGRLPLLDVPSFLVLEDSKKRLRLWRYGRSYVGHHLVLDGLRVGGNLDLAGLHCGGAIRGTGMRIDGELIAKPSVEIADFAFPRSSRGQRRARALREACMDMTWFAEDTPQHVHLKELRDGYRFFPLEHDQLEGDWKFHLHGVMVARTVANEILIRDLELQGGADLAGCVVGRGSGSDEPIDREPFRLENARLGGSLWFSDWSCERLVASVKQDPIEYAQFCEAFLRDTGPAENPDRVLGERLRETFESMEPVNARVFGDVTVRNCRFDSIIDLTGLTAVSGNVRLVDLHLDGDLRAIGCPTEFDRRARPYRLCTKAERLSLELLRCDGNVRLTGIELDGALSAHNLTVSGTTTLATEASPDRPAQRAHVGGDVDLSDSIFGILHFGTVQGAKGTLQLRRSKVAMLDLVHVLPRSIDAMAARVDHWAVPSSVRIGSIVDRIQPFASDVYASVERWLRSIGKSGDADQVYRKMMRRATRANFVDDLRNVFNPRADLRGPRRWLARLLAPFTLVFNAVFRGLFYVLYGLLTGWGVGRFRLASMLEVLLATSFALSAGSVNHAEPESAARCRDYAVQGVSIAVPVIALLEEPPLDDFAEQGDALLAWDCFTPLPPVPLAGISPRGMSLLLNVLGWILWPLLLLSLTAYIRRER